ncbi:putative lipoprotein [Spiroplasma kunkelii CR2-3x]|uniref:Putative lipoprotein n=1 Tax=Spiroplasma kunkelii CR2-3x TaxID=273035 RepID=A0A0K2JFC6_SPIKU|nr:lipoprotein [Spiroplasma kunkelii]ALA96951.1 putative lipoprotein [Spiroplasma kunkelii CR2-3x]
MKKLLTLFGAITLLGTSATSLVGCNKTEQEYTPNELKKLKQKKKIDTTDKNIKDNLEWIAPQEEPFNIIDNHNHYFYVVWRGVKIGGTDEDVRVEYGIWRIIKFKYNYSSPLILDTDIFGNSLSLELKENKIYLGIKPNGYDYIFNHWISSDYTYKKNIKEVYRWNLETKEPNLVIDNDGNIKVNEG